MHPYYRDYNRVAWFLAQYKVAFTLLPIDQTSSQCGVDIEFGRHFQKWAILPIFLTRRMGKLKGPLVTILRICNIIIDHVSIFR